MLFLKYSILFVIFIVQGKYIKKQYSKQHFLVFVRDELKKTILSKIVSAKKKKLSN